MWDKHELQQNWFCAVCDSFLFWLLISNDGVKIDYLFMLFIIYSTNKLKFASITNASTVHVTRKYCWTFRNVKKMATHWFWRHVDMRKFPNAKYHAQMRVRHKWFIKKYPNNKGWSYLSQLCDSLMISIKFKWQKDDVLEQKYFTGSKSLLTSNHTSKACVSYKVLNSTTICKKCGATTSSRRQDECCIPNAWSSHTH